MTVKGKHAFQSTLLDTGDPLRPGSNAWNADIPITMLSGFIAARYSPNEGPVEEYSLANGGGIGIVTNVAAKTVTFTLQPHGHSASDIADFTEAVQDAIGATLMAGSGITIAYNDPANTITIAASGGGGGGVGQQTIFVPAGAITPRTTNGAARGTVETATNRIMISSLDFDTATQEFAQFAVQMPKGWDEGTLVCQFLWSHAAAATNFGVAWAIEAVAFADDDAADAAFGTAVQVADTGGTTNDIYISPETGPLTVAGSPGNEEWVVFQVKRVPADAADTLAVDARLLGVKIHYTTNAATDD
jgi:hypothetical protein